jgi:hypothetical protein
MNFKFKFSLIAFFITACGGAALAQNSGVILGQDTSRRVITTAVPFVNFTPDARSAGMGDVGAAISADANAVHWNAAKLPFIASDVGFSLSYTPWLGNLINDMSISYLSGYKKLDNNQAIAGSLRYFDLGDIELTDVGPNNQPISLGIFNPREISLDATYARKLSERLALGVTGRFIHSNLSGNITSNMNNEGRPGVSVAADVSVFWRNELIQMGEGSEFALAAVISNVGSKITYNSAEDMDFIPTNLRLGTALTKALDPSNKITFGLDFNKLLVPTPPVYSFDANGNLIRDPNGNPVIARGRNPYRPLLSGIFGSFSDAPDGFREELQEIMISFGMEYWYRETFALRTGYFHENMEKGNRRYFTLGAGLRQNSFGIDFAYLVPVIQNHPLAETIRFTLHFNFNKPSTQVLPGNL